MAASNRNLYIAAAVSCLTAALFGYAVGFIGGMLVLPSFLLQFHLDAISSAELASARSTMVTIWMVGALMGVPMAMPLCSKNGRKACFYLISLLYTLGAGLQLASSGNFGIFVAGRFLNGLAVGAGTLVSPMYISEVSPNSERGMLMSGYQAVLQLSALLGFWGAFISHAIFPSSSSLQWQLPIMLQLLPGVLLFFGTLLIPDSPRFYVSKGRFKDAEKALAWLRRQGPGHPELLREMLEIQKGTGDSLVATSKRTLFSELMKKDVRQRLTLGIVIMMAQNMVGQNALNFYTPVIFISAGYTSISTSLFLTGLFGLIKLMSAIAFMFIFIRLKTNRFWLKTGCFACTVCMVVLAYYVKNLPSPDESVHQRPHLPGSSIVPVVMVYTFSFFYTISLGPISWNICSEIFPLHINAQCCAITTCTQWIGQIIVAAITPRLLSAVGWGMYLFYACFCFITLVWVWTFVPETRDVALGKPMDDLFGALPEEADEDGEEAMETLETMAPLLGPRGRRGSLAAYT